jgi:hypothetical protein
MSKVIKGVSIVIKCDSRDLIDKMSKVIKGVSIVIKCDGRDLIDKMSKVVKGVSIVIKRVYNEISLKMGSNENWPSPCRKVLFCIHYLVTNQANHIKYILADSRSLYNTWRHRGRNLLLPVQLVPITTKVVSLNPDQARLLDTTLCDKVGQ